MLDAVEPRQRSKPSLDRAVELLLLIENGGDLGVDRPIQLGVVWWRRGRRLLMLQQRFRKASQMIESCPLDAV